MHPSTKHLQVYQDNQRLARYLVSLMKWETANLSYCYLAVLLGSPPNKLRLLNGR